MRRSSQVATDDRPSQCLSDHRQGQLDASWAVWFSGFTIMSADGPDAQTLTALTGAIADQSALRGVLNRVWDLNLSVVS